MESSLKVVLSVCVRASVETGVIGSACVVPSSSMSSLVAVLINTVPCFGTNADKNVEVEGSVSVSMIVIVSTGVNRS